MEKHQDLVEHYPSSLHVQMVSWECTSIVVEHYPSSLHVLMFVYMPTKLFHTKRLNLKQLPVKLECAMSNSTNVYLSGLMISCWLCRKDSVKPSCILHKKLYGCGVLSADLACICASTQVGDCLVVRLPLLLFCSFFLSLYSYTTRNPN